MPDSDWLARLKQTIALDIARFQSAGLPPKAVVEKLFAIPEVAQAFHLRENRRRPLALDPSTDEEKQEIIDALKRAAAWLEPSGPNIAEQLRGIAAALDDGGASVD